MHDNSAFHCQTCENIMARYPGLHPDLIDWFKKLRESHPEAHVAVAGRDKKDQDEAFYRGSSMKQWPHSAHNCNCALDVFPLINGRAEWGHEWFNRVIPATLYGGLRWLGAMTGGLQDFDHVEIRNFEDLLSQKKVSLIE